MADKPPLIIRALLRLAHRPASTEPAVVDELRFQREESEAAHARDITRRRQRISTGHPIEDTIYPSGSKGGKP